MIGVLAGNKHISGKWLTVAFILLGAVIGTLLVVVPLLYVLAFAGALCVVFLTVGKPELSILAIVVIIASVIDEGVLPLIPLGPGSLNVPDVLVLVLVPMSLWKHLSNQEAAAESPVSKALLLFMLYAIFTAGMSILYQGMDLNTVLRVFRVVSYYLIYFMVTNLVTTKRQISFLVNGLFFIACAVAAIMVVQLVIGDSVQLIPGKQYKVSVLEEELDAMRLQPPGQTLLLATFVTAMAFLVNYRTASFLRSRYTYLLMLLGAGVLLTYVRTYLLAIALVTCAYLVLGTSRDRRRLAALLASGGALLLLLVAASWGSGGKLGTTFSAMSGRFLTLFAGKELVQSNSLNDRQLENSYAMQEIKAHPLLGIGLGKDYRPQIYGPEDIITYYVHNVYLWLILDFGLPGFLVFLWFFALFLLRAVRHFKEQEDPYLRSVATGAMLVGMALLPMALVIPLFMEWHSIVVISILVGLSETIIIHHRPDRKAKRSLAAPEGGVPVAENAAR